MELTYDFQAEEAVLGAILLRPDSINKVLDLLSYKDFYKPINGMIYKAMVICSERNMAIDPLIILDTMKKDIDISKFGGEEAIFQAIKNVPTASNISVYAKIVKDRSILRHLIDVSSQIIESASSPKDDVNDILDRAENMIYGISQNISRKEITHVKDLINKELARLEEVYKNREMVTGISSGIKSLDKLISGFQKSDLSIIAARPSMGKTAFMLNIAYNASVIKNKKVLIFSLEMSDSQIFQRLVSLGSQVSLEKLKNGFLNEEEWGRVGLITSRLAESGIYVADTPSITVMEIRALCRRLKSSAGLDMVVIDYMQLISSASYRGDNRQEEVSDISRALKCLARELDIPVIVASQLSRAPEQRTDKKPVLSDLRSSGAIEQDADIVGFLYRDEYYNEDSSQQGIAELKIAKQRNGPIGNVKLRFFKEFGRFNDYIPS
jgi:replicative DNA helicase